MTDIQAVILADSFQKKFSPISDEIPKVLFPFGNMPILEHTLQWLTSNNISDIFILYQSQPQQIEAYVASRKSIKKYRNIRLIHTLDSKSYGDALRELYTHKVIQQDFILVYGDIVTNVNLQDPIKKYLENKEKNKLNIFLMVMHKVQRLYEEERYIYTVDISNQLIQIDKLSTKTQIQIPRSKLNDVKLEKGMPSNITIHSNLLDSGIFICSRDVLKCFHENYPFADITEDFCREMLNSEIQEEKLHIYITPKQEISYRIHHPHAYYQINQRYLARFFYPCVPENSTIQYEDFYKYIGKKSKVHATAAISQLSHIGTECVIGQNSVISKTIVGHQCKIGNNCQIINSILWEGVQIEDNTIIKDSIIAHKGQIGQNCIIPSGSLVGPNAKIASGTELKEPSMIKAVDGQEASIKNCTLSFGERMGDPLIQDSYLKDNIEIDSDSEAISSNPIPMTKPEIQIEDMARLIISCKDDEQYIEQAIVNVETLKVNQNNTFMEILAAFLPAFLQQLDPHADSIKEKFAKWKDFFLRFVSESECDCYFEELQKFCVKNDKFYLHQLLQVSFMNSILTEAQIIAYHKKMLECEDEFAKNFVELNDKFYQYLCQQQEAAQQEQEQLEEGYEYVYEYEEGEQQDEHQQEEQQPDQGTQN